MRHFFHAGIQLDLPFAIWKMPQSSVVHAALQLDAHTERVETLEAAVTGFLVGEFEKEKGRLLIRSDVRINSQHHEVLRAPEYQGSNDKFERFLQAMDRFQHQSDFDFRLFLAPSPQAYTDKAHFIRLAARCKNAIQEGCYQKVVPSRRTKVALKQNFHPIDELFKLCHAYDHAFVSLFFIPHKGLWIGATPELLLSVDENKVFQTVSLAGTQEARNHMELSKVAWMQKDIEEQALVSRYIINCFKKIRLREFIEYGPKAVQAGHLIHLKTRFSVNMEAVNFPQLAGVMLDLLHPTSAVCGMPMLPAAQLLKRHEGYERELYSGYIGPVNHQNTTALYVNLRCGRIYSNGMALFAGAGVTEDSDPELEWQETESKLQTLRSIIK